MSRTSQPSTNPVKFAEPRPFSDPEAAVRKLIEIAIRWKDYQFSLRKFGLLQRNRLLQLRFSLEAPSREFASLSAVQRGGSARGCLSSDDCNMVKPMAARSQTIGYPAVATCRKIVAVNRSR